MLDAFLQLQAALLQTFMECVAMTVQADSQ